MKALVVPRSAWPLRCLPVSAWHKDEHITRLLRAEDELAKLCGLRRQQSDIDAKAIEVLVREALTGDSVYRVTAAMDLLYDAHESYPAVLAAFASLARNLGAKAYKRTRCCFAYLRLNENHREVLGKNGAEVKADWDHFTALQAQAEELLEGLRAG